jgi:hypothetical protein
MLQHKFTKTLLQSVIENMNIALFVSYLFNNKNYKAAGINIIFVGCWLKFYLVIHFHNRMLTYNASCCFPTYPWIRPWTQEWEPFLVESLCLQFWTFPEPPTFVLSVQQNKHPEESMQHTFKSDTLHLTANKSKVSRGNLLHCWFQDCLVQPNVCSEL